MSEAVTETDTSLNLANKTLQDYEVISVIGNGSFGTCFKVRDKETGKLYAWKGLNYDELSESEKKALVSEISVLRQLQHPNIVQYYHHLVNHEAKLIFIVMECCECDLAQLIAKARIQCKRFEEKYIWRVLFQICKALQVCHNKIKQGTILHRDIKPANVFLDANGNAKLGDFGLARMLRRNESFAQSFVGTPYYMSPELVKGTKYDRKSDVWAVGCLTYEMCALQPPFRGRKFNQLSANISNGHFSSIPDAYSSDLQAIIAFMLEVENYQRPSIEIISRHPTVVRNISELGNEFPKLIKAEVHFYNGTKTEDQACCKLQYNSLTDLSSTMFTEQNSFNEEYGQRCVSGTPFTPELRAELFYSAQRRVFPKHTFQRSDPELYESNMRCKEYAKVDDETYKSIQPRAALRTYSSILPNSPQTVKNEYDKSPALLTKNIFDRTLQERLHAIRAQESLLEQKAANLNAREQQLNEKEKCLQHLERNLYERTIKFEREMSDPATINKLNTEEAIIAFPPPSSSDHLPPPIPPRKPKTHNDTYCTIDDSLLQQPTMVKMSLPIFPTFRKVVTFQSPKKFIKYDIENVVKPKSVVGTKSNQTNNINNNRQMRVSITSKGSDESTESNPHRRKSILSTIFGLQRNNIKNSMKVTAATKVSTKERPPLAIKNEQVLVKCETSELSNIWTKEHKRAAFDLLAAMNAAEKNVGTNIQTFDNHRHASASSSYKLRHSERHSNTLHRNRIRRSLMVAPKSHSSSEQHEHIKV